MQFTPEIQRDNQSPAAIFARSTPLGGRVLQRGETLYEHGMPLRGVYAVESGLFSLSAFSPNGNTPVEISLGFAGRERFLGLVDMIENSLTYSQSARAEAPSRVIRYSSVPREMDMALLRSIVADHYGVLDSALAGTIEKRMGQYFFGFIENAAGIKGSSVSLNEDGSITIHKTHAEIASALGVHRESLSRVISSARKRGMIEKRDRGNVITIRNPSEFFNTYC